MTDDQERDLFQQVNEASGRLMAGLVPRGAMQDAKRLAETASPYPWQEVVQRLLQDPVDPQALTQQSARAQRDWILRGGRQDPGKGMKRRAKGLLAGLIVKGLFFLLFLAALVVLLNLVLHRWPDLNIYALLDFAKEKWPETFGR